MKFLHLSDLHIHMHQADNKDTNTLLALVKDRYPEHYLIVTGDITDDGHPRQFENAQKALMDFKGRVFICPGNHDFGVLGNFYSYERARRFDEFLSGPLDQGGTFTGDNTPVVNMVRDASAEVMIIALDTNLETSHPFDFACGEVGESQLAALRTVLENPCSDRVVKLLMFSSPSLCPQSSVHGTEGRGPIDPGHVRPGQPGSFRAQACVRPESLSRAKPLLPGLG